MHKARFVLQLQHFQARLVCVGLVCRAAEDACDRGLRMQLVATKDLPLCGSVQYTGTRLVCCWGCLTQEPQKHTQAVSSRLTSMLCAQGLVWNGERMVNA